MARTITTLTKTPTGYATQDGRWTVNPVTMGSGVTGWAGGTGWSNGHREWEVTDTAGQIIFPGNRHSKIVQRLYEARDLISRHS
ncbi:hypothetical protein GS896_27495 [Rhodococcus hoagii]|nr:hypothetical protein [Prescottella equi]MBM4570257.1 hypothetical protein [Prescottella equi]MBM4574805.1 hypothetical protein [Prescottella equi]MBM4575110.1 hypothetical protein [Prescottella equi]MBM4653997.1 hypothetical protein [Prescottella equi]